MIYILEDNLSRDFRYQMLNIDYPYVLEESINDRDILGLGLPSENNFQSITSFVSLALLWQRDSGRCNLAWIPPETRDLLSLRVNND